MKLMLIALALIGTVMAITEVDKQPKELWFKALQVGIHQDARCAPCKRGFVKCMPCLRCVGSDNEDKMCKACGHVCSEYLGCHLCLNFRETKLITEYPKELTFKG